MLKLPPVSLHHWHMHSLNIEKSLEVETYLWPRCHIYIFNLQYTKLL